MHRMLLKSKLHRLTVTEANLHYEGSLTIDANLLAAADILPFEEIHIWNVTRGSRLATYAIPGESGSGICCINGAAAHQVHPGDLIIVATFAGFSENEAREHQPKILLINEKNAVA